MAAPSVLDFQSCIQHCVRTKGEYVRLFASLPRSFNIRCDGKEIFFLAPIPRVGNTLFSVNVTSEDGTHNWKKVRIIIVIGILWVVPADIIKSTEKSSNMGIKPFCRSAWTHPSIYFIKMFIVALNHILFYRCCI